MSARLLHARPREHVLGPTRPSTLVVRRSPQLLAINLLATTYVVCPQRTRFALHHARRWCTTKDTDSHTGTKSDVKSGADRAPLSAHDQTSARFHRAADKNTSVRPEDSPFANFHRQRSTTSRRWEWEAPRSHSTTEAASPPSPTPNERLASPTDTANVSDAAPPTDTQRSAATTGVFPPASSSPSPSANSSGAEGDPNVKRMSLTIRPPQQRARDRRYVSPDPAPSTSATHAHPHTHPYAESRADVLRRRSGLTPTDGGAREDGSGTNNVPRHSLGSGVSYAAADPKNFNTRLTLHPQRGIARFTEPVKRIVLLRNGVSEANEDISAYVRTPDWRIPLTQEGRLQCVESGRQLADLVGDEPVYFYYSPYIRSRQSLRYVLEGYDQRRLETLQGTASERLQWWERDDDDEHNTSRAVAEATSSELMREHRPHTARTQLAAHELSRSQPALAALSSCFTTTGTVGASGVNLTSLTNQEAAVAAAEAAMRNENALSADMNAPPASTAPGSNHVLPTGPSLVMRSGTLNRIIGVREDVRLRDGDIGRYNDLDALLYHLREREQYGRFFYRFPFGESGADVCDRVTSFLDAFQRERVDFPMDTNVVIITHGLTIRMLIKRWFHLTVDTFHRMQSPPSASLSTLTRLHHQSSFRLDEACVDLMTLPQSLNEHNGYKYRNKRLLGSMSTGAPYM